MEEEKRRMPNIESASLEEKEGKDREREREREAKQSFHKVQSRARCLQ